ncbi:MAG: PEP/pyruvate-binding domain-containing protein [Eubacteriales bacterium]|nr:PEP/pyruvate-binding domain-containing protein [Eubacteriales bacterium]
MAAFERILSGIPQMDRALNNIRLGDNVVWRLSNLEQAHLFFDPYVEQAIADGRNLIYIRFASHPPLVSEREGVKIEHVELSHRFETFTVAIHEIIEREGYDAFYVFDCLSELQTAWATDLMMGNFFRVTCPFLFILDTVAFFPIIRGMHSYHAINKIQETTQLFLDVYEEEQPEGAVSADEPGPVYVRPLKVWNRDSETMFLPHEYDPVTGSFSPLLDGIETSRFYEALDEGDGELAYDSRDSWDRYFEKARKKTAERQDVSEECSRMCNIMLTRDERLRPLVKKHFTPQDYFRVKSKMIGTGMVGGKACGMLLARKILENAGAQFAGKMEPHDSFYIGSDVFYTYIVENGLWDLRIRQRRGEEYYSIAPTFAEKLKEGRFPQELELRFVKMLEYYGKDPFIVRSSSILEDGFGNAFAGKYESIFCSNSGSLPERLTELENAVRTVYASTQSLSVLEYRQQRGLDKRDEQMALLVQRVSGSYYDEYYMPCAAGVGYSYSPYIYGKEADPEQGMVRLVAGLGTAAVDRAEGSYPCIIQMDNPKASFYAPVAERHKFSQRRIDAVSRPARNVEHLPMEKLRPHLPPFLRNLLLEHDTQAEARFMDRGEYRDIRFVSCRGLVKKEDLMGDLRTILRLLSDEYQNAVDIEFTINLSQNGQYRINLLQCRPLQVLRMDAGVLESAEPLDLPEQESGKTGSSVSGEQESGPEGRAGERESSADAVHSGSGAPVSEISADRILLETRGASMGMSRQKKVDVIVSVDPIAYYNMPYNDKYSVSVCIGTINRYYRAKGKCMVLLVPGRIGTSSPELGVPTTFADINGFEMLCEISVSEAGYNPELSYGSHFFQDLVESGILYAAAFENEHTVRFNLSGIKKLPNRVSDIDQAFTPLSGIVGVYETAEEGCRLWFDMREGHLMLYK